VICSCMLPRWLFTVEHPSPSDFQPENPYPTPHFKDPRAHKGPRLTVGPCAESLRLDRTTISACFPLSEQALAQEPREALELP
jgi:hypothetical protein